MSLISLARVSEAKSVKPKSILKEDFLDPAQTYVGVWDIETSGLKGDWDIVLCSAIKPYGHDVKPTITKIDLDARDLLKAEDGLIEEINDSLNEYDGLISYYGTGFDLRMLRTRSFAHGLKPIPKKHHLDMYFTAKRILNTGSKRMDRINQLLQIANPDGSPKKTPLEIYQWSRVVHGRDKELFEYIIDHNMKDVEILENIAYMFRDFVPDRITRY